MNAFKPEASTTTIPCIGLNADDAAKAIGISKKMLQSLVASGELPVVEFSRQTQVFDPADLKKLIESRKKTRTPQKG